MTRGRDRKGGGGGTFIMSRATITWWAIPACFRRHERASIVCIIRLLQYVQMWVPLWPVGLCDVSHHTEQAVEHFFGYHRIGNPFHAQKSWELLHTLGCFICTFVLGSHQEPASQKLACDVQTRAAIDIDTGPALGVYNKCLLSETRREQAQPRWEY